MYKFMMILICLLMVFPSVATQVKPKELNQLVMESDAIVEVDIADVYGKDKFGSIIRSPEMTTGPGLDNKIVLYACSTSILFKVEGITVPKCFETTIWKKWHLSLKSFLHFQSESVILLLKGKELQRVYPGYFIWPLERKNEIEELIKKRKD